MSLADNTFRSAACPNSSSCSIAIAGERVDWYPGPGEYCPECGEALSTLDGVLPPNAETPIAVELAPPHIDAQPVHAGPSLRATRPRMPRWFWLIAATVLAAIAIIYAQRRAIATGDVGPVVDVCPGPSVQQLAGELVRAYALKSGDRPWIFSESAHCDVRLLATVRGSNSVIARDGIVAIVNPLNSIARISEKQLRGIFSGTIRDWSELGGPRGAIVPILPVATSDEAKALAASLFYGVDFGAHVRRAGSSSDVTRAVSGADRLSRGAIGFVAFSQAVPARVLPIAYLPPPNVLSIATRRYPYTLAVAVQAESLRGAAAAAGFIDYAHSDEGATIVTKNGLVASGAP